MGQDKLLLPWNGERLVDRAAAALRATCPQLYCAGRDLGLPGFRHLEDARPDSGPLAGLVAALEAAGVGLVLALAGDLPGVTVEFLQALQREAELTPDRVLLPATRRGIEPLAAAWPAAGAAPLRAALEAGQRSLHRAVRDLPHRLWPLPDSAKMRAALRNLNAPEDWRAFTGGDLPREDPDRA